MNAASCSNESGIDEAGTELVVLESETVRRLDIVVYICGTCATCVVQLVQFRPSRILFACSSGHRKR